MAYLRDDEHIIEQFVHSQLSGWVRPVEVVLNDQIA
jgi:hypothetical protein